MAKDLSKVRIQDLLATLPPQWPETELRARIRATTSASECRVVVLDDDPTGTQTVHSLPVLTEWTVEALASAWAEAQTTFYILINLGVRKAQVLGQIVPGVPVWRLGQESKYPGLPDVVFPGNVGEASDLASSSLIEPLTNRELEVLELMAQRMTNKEIAARLVVSVGTVKQHAYNINQKLSVRGRRQAVAKATSLGILSTS